MYKYEMQRYVEENFKKIIEDHFEVLGHRILWPNMNMKQLADNFDAISFYKDWSESSDFKVSVFLEEIEGDEEDNKDNEGTQL